MNFNGLALRLYLVAWGKWAEMLINTSFAALNVAHEQCCWKFLVRLEIVK